MASGGLSDAVGRLQQSIETQAGRSLGVRLQIRDYSNEGLAGLDRVFVGLGATLDGMDEALLAALPDIRQAISDVFASEGASGRGAWAPLAPRTIADRLRKGYGPGPILQRSGKLRAHVLATPAVTTRRADVVELRIAPSPVVAGTGRPYFRAQSLGSGHSNLPARPMVTIGPGAAARITGVVSRALRERAMREIG